VSSPLIDLALRTVGGIAAPGGGRGRLSILIYHRVHPDDASDPDDVTAAEFERQMRALRANFSPLPLQEAIGRLGAGSLPPRAVSVTFDDGYADNAEIALPILGRCGIPATFFVATGYLNGGRMWNDTVIEAVKRLPGPSADLSAFGMGVVSTGSPAAKRAAVAQILGQWKYRPFAEREGLAASLGQLAGVLPQSVLMMRDAQVKELRAAGMDIGAHTVSHPILAMAADADARREIIESRRYLGELLREPIPLFAYPNGQPGRDYDARHVAMVREAGYQAAVSTAWGVAARRSEVFQLPRFTPWDREPRKYALRLIANYRKLGAEVPTVSPLIVDA
jgi:peptidoglycan/xylan/chitin deacetylase (PgdA/CDA1 family)